MTHTLDNPRRRAARPAPGAQSGENELPRYDLPALAAEAATDKVYDESAKVRVTQQDIRNLLERRRRSHP